MVTNIEWLESMKMDLETEKVIDLVFSVNFPESWKDNPDFYQYLSKLGGFDVEQLNKEPEHLTEDKNSILLQTQELAFTNYKTFIRTAESSREIFKQFNETERRLDNLVNKLPEFSSKCQSFCDTSKDINTHRRLNSLTLTRNAELLEILEMPQLMESCLRSNQYNEALELSQYARQLGTKHGDIPIIASIVAEIENSWSGMVSQVVASLRGDLPLPRCLQLVGLLRSMEAFTEPELRIKFLQARDSWLQGLLNAIPTDDGNQHLTKTIELSRIHLFNIITQYRAIFNDDDHLTTSRDIIINEGAIFHHWLEEKISEFLTTLEKDLPRVTSIDSILGQCTYFGLSFSRVGADFTSRMAYVFVAAIGNKFETAVRRTTRKFEKDMETFTLINKLRKMDTKCETSVLSEYPPEQLVEFFPLAEYCNGLISAFNEIRLCAPVALAETCTNLLEESLKTVAKAMLVFYKQEQQAFTSAERDNMIKFAECLSEQLIPYVQYCIHVIFPPNETAKNMGLTANQLQKEGITYLDKKCIVRSLTPLLPIQLISKDIVSNPTISLEPVDGSQRITLGEDKNDKNEKTNEQLSDKCEGTIIEGSPVTSTTSTTSGELASSQNNLISEISVSVSSKPDDQRRTET